MHNYLRLKIFIIFSAGGLLNGSYVSAQTKYKMTTDIPASIPTPGKVESRIGTLKFVDGFPDQSTVDKIYDNLDFQRGTQAFLTGLPIVFCRRGAKIMSQFWSGESNRQHIRAAAGFQITFFNSKYYYARILSYGWI